MGGTGECMVVPVLLIDQQRATCTCSPLPLPLNSMPHSSGVQQGGEEQIRMGAAAADGTAHWNHWTSGRWGRASGEGGQSHCHWRSCTDDQERQQKVCRGAWGCGDGCGCVSCALACTHDDDGDMAFPRTKGPCLFWKAPASAC